MAATNFSGRGLNPAADPSLARGRSESQSVSAPQRVRDGRRLILVGFIIAVMGIIAYCVVGLNAPTETGAVSGLGNFVAPSLGIIGLGTLLWLIGSIRFLKGAMDNDEDVAGMDL